ncbi:MAG: 3-hydroxyisobutyrate dehydrogenase [Chloroflexi bacterium]|nr:3-hydroxyisobutyrate dehydrogenase [Chloroflexota bacterium]
MRHAAARGTIPATLVEGIKMAKRVGFVGVGTMGKLMAINLLKRHIPVTAYDLNPAPLDELREYGAEIVDSAKAAAAAGEVIVTMLPSSPHVEAAVLGAGGVLEGMRPGSVLVDMSTIDPLVSKSVAEKVAAAGFTMLDAPVSGGSVGARDATLTIMVGGPAGVFEEVRPILEAMGKNVIHCGENGMGEVVKVVNNLIAGVSMAVVAEAYNIGIRAGADPKVMYDVISKSSGRCWSHDVNLPIGDVIPVTPANQDYEPGFMVDLMRKDLGLAISAAKGVQAPAIMAAAAEQLYGSASNLGFGRRDMSAVVKAVTALSGPDEPDA